jgi:mitochondrial inner membrane protease ATP23
MSSGDANTTVETKDREKCEYLLKKTLERNKKVVRLLDAIEGLGCKIPDNFFNCRRCPPDQAISGGFVVHNGKTPPSEYNPQVVICDNKILESSSFENTVVHELTHAYDQCRLKIDYTNCLHHACTEIRASSLSGECDFLHEVYRGPARVTLAAGHQKCVKRRANLSVSANPQCTNVAADAVEAAFLPCYADRAPFAPHEKT